jgi:plastocyanin
MKIVYGILLTALLVLSACASQTGNDADVVKPDPIQKVEPQVQPVAEPKAPVQETDIVKESQIQGPALSSTEIRYLGAGGFDSENLNLKVGDIVTWKNGDSKSGALIVFKDGKAFENSARLNAEDSYELEFTLPGEYKFWWNIAYGIQGGSIKVE